LAAAPLPVEDEPAVLQGEVLPDIEGEMIVEPPPVEAAAAPKSDDDFLEPAPAAAAPPPASAPASEDDFLEPAPAAAPVEPPARTGPFVVEARDSADPLAAMSWDTSPAALGEILPPPKPVEPPAAPAPAPLAPVAPGAAVAPAPPSPQPAPAPKVDPFLSWPAPVVPAAPAAPVVADLAAIEGDLARDVTPEKIVRGLLQACEGRFTAAVFLVFDGPLARAREGFSPAGPIKFTDGFAIPLDGPSLVRAAAERGSPVLAAAGAGADATLCTRLEIPLGSPCAVVPFALHGTVFAALWGCRGSLPARTQLAEELASIAALGARAFTRLSLAMAPAR